MILYYSGTGNSRYAAERIGREIGDEVLNLFERLKERDFSELHSERPWVVVTPVYAWRIPRILQEWLLETELTGSRQIYFVVTCGAGIGNAGKYARALCERKRMEYRGCLEVLMPENYIAMFAAPREDEARKIIGRAEKIIDQAAEAVRAGQPFPEKTVTLTDRVLSGAVNPIFYPMFVHADKFYVTDACISCGKCVKVCPLGNIRLENGRPVWGKNCTHCMACICRCPREAVEYGKHSRGLPRYVFPGEKTEEGEDCPEGQELRKGGNER